MVCQNLTISESRSEHIVRPYKQLLHALISFEICPSQLKLWAVKEKALKQHKISLQHGPLVHQN